MMQKSALILISLLALWSCTKVAFTGRSQAALLPQSSMLAMSTDAYNDFLSQNKVITGTSDAEMVKRIGKRIQMSAEKYYRENNMMDQLQGYNWEFNLVDDPQVNAWCMEGGKVVVYTGILPITQNEDGLAVVMGHEVAHALAHHGNERMTQSLASQAGGMALDAALTKQPSMTRDLLLNAYGVGVQVGALLPFSRQQESEADEIGLYLMAIAGYNPEEAGPFWQRMSQGAGQTPPEFLSTHPDPDNRSKKLQEMVPKAKEYAAQYSLD